MFPKFINLKFGVCGTPNSVKTLSDFLKSALKSNNELVIYDGVLCLSWLFGNSFFFFFSYEFIYLLGNSLKELRVVKEKKQQYYFLSHLLE